MGYGDMGIMGRNIDSSRTRTINEIQKQITTKNNRNGECKINNKGNHMQTSEHGVAKAY